jgi:S-adenosylmethionine hydrolase
MARSFSRTITTPAAARMVRPTTRPVVSLLTDFGARDPSAGIMRAVVQGIAHDAVVIDISHEVEKFRVRDAALLLWCSVPYLPHGAHVAVVDPGVGTERRALAIETARGDLLVGPDNGILLPAATRLGGITRVHQLTSPQYRLPVISSSFHGRDIFAPAAAHLAMGLPLEFLGPAVDPRSLLVLDWPEPQIFAGILRSQVIYLDTFGNVKLSALGPDLQAALGYLQYGERLWVRLTDQFGSNDVEATWSETFGRVGLGQLLLTEDSYGRLSLAINQGSAVQAIGVREDVEVLVTRQQLPRVDEELTAPPAAAVPAWTGDPGTGAWGPPPDAAWGPPPDGGPPTMWAAPPVDAPPAWAPPMSPAPDDLPGPAAAPAQPAPASDAPVASIPAPEAPRSSGRWRR